MKSFFLSVVSLVVSATAIAAVPPGATVGKPIWRGAGCQASNDGERVEVTAATTQAAPLDRKGCFLAMPIHVPEGYQVSLPKASASVKTFLSAEANAHYSVELFFAGGKEPKIAQDLKGPSQVELPIQLNSTPVWSECGRDVSVRANTSIFVETRSKPTPASSLLALQIGEMDWKRCSAKE